VRCPDEGLNRIVSYRIVSYRVKVHAQGIVGATGKLVRYFYSARTMELGARWSVLHGAQTVRGRCCSARAIRDTRPGKRGIQDPTLWRPRARRGGYRCAIRSLSSLVSDQAYTEHRALYSGLTPATSQPQPQPRHTLSRQAPPRTVGLHTRTHVLRQRSGHTGRLRL
jgi:hypothetical protein